MRFNPSPRLLFFVVMGAVALGAGCAHQYTYVPVGPGAAGGPAAQYPVPPSAPQGTVYVTSFGFTDFDNGQGGSQRLLHARLAVSNGSSVPWEVDGRQQYVTAPGVAPQSAAFLNTDAGQGPVYPVAPGAANVFDLYFAVPPGADNLGGFGLDWSVNAAGQVVQEQTTFERIEDTGYSYAAYPPYVTVGLGFGVGWWYGPYYPYRHYPPLIHGYYYAPHRAWGGPYHGAPAGGWRGAPPRAGTWHGTPPASGGWRGTPPASGGGAWRGSPPSAPRSAPFHGTPPSHGGGFRGGGGHRH
jgi:hypothetical protein